MAPKLTTCRSCGASVFFATTAQGKTTILDARRYVIAVLDPDSPDHAPTVREHVSGYSSHFASCPNSQDHRKPPEKRERLETPDAVK